MMGQKEMTMTVATEEKGGGTLRRMILVLTIALVMVAMLAVTGSPAFARTQPFNPDCYGNPGYTHGEPHHPCGHKT
jgi:hypothetical protein